MWIPTANCSLVERDLVGTQFWCIRSSNAQIGSQTPVFEQVTQVNLGGVRAGGNVNPGGLTAQIFLADGSLGWTYEQQCLHDVQCSAAKLQHRHGRDVRAQHGWRADL